jgi:RNA 3'-terminal phosphate cyclase (ATP)
VFAPFVENFGIKFDLKLIRRGFYPKGGGCAVLKTQPLKFVKPITFLEQGDVNQIRILSFAAGKVPEHVSTNTLFINLVFSFGSTFNQLMLCTVA